MQLIVRRGTTQTRVRFLLLAEDGHAGARTGLSAHSSALTVAYLREGDTRPTPLHLVAWDPGAPAPGAFREIDPALMPGLYELALPDEACAHGANRVMLMVQAPGTAPRLIHIDLVGYDPYDQDRLGLDCLSRDARHAVISSAFREVVPDIVDEFRRTLPPAP